MSNKHQKINLEPAKTREQIIGEYVLFLAESGYTDIQRVCAVVIREAPIWAAKKVSDETENEDEPK